MGGPPLYNICPCDCSLRVSILPTRQSSSRQPYRRLLSGKRHKNLTLLMMMTVMVMVLLIRCLSSCGISRCGPVSPLELRRPLSQTFLSDSHK